MKEDSVFMKLAELDRPKKDTPKKEDVNKKAPEAESKVYYRTMGNIHSALEAQKIFNPQMSQPMVKPPSAAMVNQGTASAQDMTGSWGRPNRVK